MKYYSIRRPILPGGYPEKELVEKIVNFDTRIYCQEIDGLAWGYVEYEKPLSTVMAADCELTPACVPPVDSAAGKGVCT